MHKRLAITIALAAVLAGAAQAEGLALPSSGSVWATRLQLASPASALDANRSLTVRLYSDYYVGRLRLGEAGGLRLTSGVLVGTRASLLGAAASSRVALSGVSLAQASSLASEPGATDSTLAWPYLGVGYSGASSRSGWGFNADLGLAAQNAGSLGRALGNGQRLDDALRELRLQPMLQLEVSYRF